MAQQDGPQTARMVIGQLPFWIFSRSGHTVSNPGVDATQAGKPTPQGRVKEGVPRSEVVAMTL
jgi:hypothetical protein